MPIPTLFPPAGVLKGTEVVGLVIPGNPLLGSKDQVAQTTTAAIAALGGGGGGGGLPTGYVQYTSASGTLNNVNAGITNTTGRLDVSLSGNTIWTGLLAGQDNQLIFVRNNSLYQLSWTIGSGSSNAANQFAGPVQTLDILPGQVQAIQYWAQAVNNWVLV